MFKKGQKSNKEADSEGGKGCSCYGKRQDSREATAPIEPKR